MTTATEIITSALEKIGYKGAEVPVEASDLKVGLEVLNDMLAELQESGINLGVDPVENAGDTVRLSRGVVGPIKLNLAARLSVPFQRPITPELSAVVSAATKSLLRITMKPFNVSPPGTLPMGSANRCDSDDSRFFPDIEKENF